MQWQNESQKEDLNVFKMNKHECSRFCFTRKHCVKVRPFINKQCFYYKNKGHIEKVYWKKNAEDKVCSNSLNMVMATHKLENEAEDSNLLASYRVNYNPAPLHQLKLTLKYMDLLFPWKLIPREKCPIQVFNHQWKTSKCIGHRCIGNAVFKLEWITWYFNH